MNREEKVAYEIIRQRIVNEIDKLESLGKDASASTLKKWRRFGAAFSWDPTVYPDLLENPTVPDKKLLQLLRGTEERFMKKWQAVEGIPLHHVIANRTGGDLGLRLPVDVWEEVKQRVFDATGARPGNSQANLNAASQFDERSHLGRYGAKGTVFDPELGLGEAPDPSVSPILHGAGTKEFGTKLGKDPVILQGSPADITEALLPEITKQQDIYRTVSNLPTTQAQRAVFTEAGLGAAFDPTTSIEQMPGIQKRAVELGLPERFAAAWQAKPSFKGGKAVLSALPIVGAVFDVGDVQAGVQAYIEPTQTPMQQFGAGLQAVSGATGLAAMVPSPATPALGAASLLTGGAASAIQSGAVSKAIEKAPEAVKTVKKIEQTLNPVSRAITNELKYIGGKVMLGKLPYFN